MESPGPHSFLDIYKNNRHSFNMTFNKRIAWIQRSLAQATARRQAILTSIPVLKQKVKALEKASAAAEAVFLKIENCCGPEWALILDEAEEVVMEINGELDLAEMALEGAQSTLWDIEGYVESTCYCAVDSARA